MSKKLNCENCEGFLRKGISDSHGEVPYNQCRMHPPTVLTSKSINAGQGLTQAAEVLSFFPIIIDPANWYCLEHREIKS